MARGGPGRQGTRPGNPSGSPGPKWAGENSWASSDPPIPEGSLPPSTFPPLPPSALPPIPLGPMQPERALEWGGPGPGAQQASQGQIGQGKH